MEIFALFFRSYSEKESGGNLNLQNESEIPRKTVGESVSAKRAGRFKPFCSASSSFSCS
jgi:hypothetical protein